MERIVTFDDGASTTLDSWGSSGPNILCVHGITSSRKSWARFATRFALANRVWAYDQRGHGDAGAVHGPMTHARMVADLAAVVSAIGEPVDALVGHSWGGAIALLGGLQGLAKRVVAIDPMVHQVLPWREDFVEDVAADLALEPGAREHAYMERYAAWGELEIAGKVHAVQHMSIDTIERLGSENRADEGGWDLRERIAGYPLSLLTFLAGRDSVVTGHDRTWLEQRLGTNARVVIFPDAGHNLHRTHFDEFVRDVEVFFLSS